ncbi:MAG: siphovirus ReqiPepy6 Gp37-like family protein [Clostridia bacterium]
MEVLVLDTDFQAKAIVDSFKSLIWTDRMYAYGDFEIYMPVSIEALDKLREDYYLWSNDSEHSMIIEDINISSDAEDGNFLIVTGRSLESILERRIIWGQKEFTGNLQDAMETMVNESIVNPSIVDRKIANFVFQRSTDERITALTIDKQYTGDDLYTVFKALCEANNIGLKIVLDEQNRFVLSLYCGLDRSYAQTTNPYVTFSPNFENIINSRYYSSKAGMRNVTLVAGEGEGVSRKTSIVGSGSGLNRRELFTDARDISSEVDGGTLTAAQYTALLNGRGEAALAKHKAKTAFEGAVETSKLFKYQEDFFIGDVVQIENEYGHEGRAYVLELVASQDEEGFSEYPTFQMIPEEGE